MVVKVFQTGGSFNEPSLLEHTHLASISGAINPVQNLIGC